MSPWSASASTIRTAHRWFIASKENIRFYGEIILVLLSVAAFGVSIVSTAAARDAANASREALQASLEQTKLQGAVPEFLGTGPFTYDAAGRKVYSASQLNNSDETFTVTGLYVINRGLAVTNVSVAVWLGDVTIDESTREVKPGPSGQISFCFPGDPVLLEPQLTTQIKFTTSCNSLTENSDNLSSKALLILTYGNGARENIYVEFTKFEGEVGGSGGSLTPSK